LEHLDKPKKKRNDIMIGIMMRSTLAVATVCFAVGAFNSSWKHYYLKYADEEDRTNGLVQEVKIMDEKKTKKGGKK
jgi:hypothetical protein